MPARRVVVVGGGITGLATACYLRKAAAEGGPDVACTVIEEATSLGGKATTRRRDGFVIDGGPDSFLTQKPWALDLAREIGLSDHLIGAGFRDGKPRPQRAYILRGGKLVPLPEGMSLVVPTKLRPFAASPLFSPLGKLRVALDLVLPRRAPDGDESLASFVTRRLGREALERIGEPLMAGIHTAEPERLSLDATFPRFREMEAKHRSLILGAREARRKASAMAPQRAATPAFVSLRGGMAELVDALACRVKGATLVEGRRVVRLELADGATADYARYRVVLDDGECLAADAIVLTTPAYVAADLVAPLSPSLSGGLRAIRYTSTATVSLGFSADGFPQLDGSGFLVPRSEHRMINAGTWSSEKLEGRAPRGRVLVRAFVGGPRREHLVDLDDTSLVELVHEELRSIVGIAAEPLVAEVFRFRRVIPQYDVGHLDRVAALERQCPPGVYLTGSAYRGVGIPDCVHGAQETARSVIAASANGQRISE